MSENEEEGDPEIGFFCAVLTYYSYAILIMFGHIREFVGSILGTSRYKEKKVKVGYSVLLKSWESFYTRRLYHRIQDCWGRPICSSPGAHINVMERVTDDNNKTLKTTGNYTPCINVGSYNYLGYADDWKETCSDDVSNVWLVVMFYGFILCSLKCCNLIRLTFSSTHDAFINIFFLFSMQSLCVFVFIFFLSF